MSAGVGRRRALRVTGVLLVAQGIVGLLWLAFPMTSRADMTSGAPAAANDVGHLVMTAATIVLILSEIGISAMAFGWRFRLYAIASAVTVVVFGALTAAQASSCRPGAHALDGPLRTDQHRAVAAVDGRPARRPDDGRRGCALPTRVTVNRGDRIAVGRHAGDAHRGRVPGR